MTVYATRLANGTDTRERLRKSDAFGLFASGPGAAREGFRPDNGGAVAVVAGTMTVTVAPFTAWVDGTVSDLQGGYTFVSDATETLTVAAGHASLPRTDVVIAEVRDTIHDGSGSTDARVRLLQGTPGGGVPALPVNTLPLRNVVVPAGASAGTGGLAAGALSTDRRVYTTGLGGVLTVASQGERDALPATNGLVVYRKDLDAFEGRRSGGWYRLSDSAVDAVTPVRDSNVNTIGPGPTVRRVGNMCTLTFEIAPAVNWSAAWPLMGIPAGYRPVGQQYFCASDATASTRYNMRIEANGNLFVINPVPTAGLSVVGSVSYPTQ